jgi:hypothetical protein
MIKFDECDRENAKKKLEEAVGFLWVAKDLLERPEITSEQFTEMLGCLSRADKNIISSLSCLEDEDED